MAASNNKDTDQPTKVNEQLEQQNNSYESDKEFQENNFYDWVNHPTLRACNSLYRIISNSHLNLIGM